MWIFVHHDMVSEQQYPKGSKKVYTSTAAFNGNELAIQVLTSSNIRKEWTHLNSVFRNYLGTTTHVVIFFSMDWDKHIQAEIAKRSMSWQLRSNKHQDLV